MTNKSFIICYYISHHQRRQKIYQYLSQHALAVQKSVFIFKGSLYLFNQCIKGLRPILDERAGDQILVYAIHQHGIEYKPQPQFKIPGVVFF